jgi:hypothetical protein
VAAPGTEAGAVLATLATADSAWETLTVTLGVPAPAGDWGAPWRLFLVDDVEGGGTARATGRDPLARLDRAASIGLVDRRTSPGCTLGLAVSRAIARASLWRAAPATDEGSAVAETETLARLTNACSPGMEDTVAFQAHPEEAIVGGGSPAGTSADPSFERGAFAFFDWMDATLAAEPGALVQAIWALSPTTSPFGAARWATKPNGFDVLRASLKGALWADSTLDDVLVRFAVHRALSDPGARVVWDVPWPTAPRTLAPSEPTSPTGASYVVVRHAGAPRGAKLRLIAQWEDWGRMRWVVLKMGPAGAPLAQLDITSADRATRAATDLEGLDDVDHLVVVGVALGSIERPFDPSQGAWMPHGWLLTLESE